MTDRIDQVIKGIADPLMRAVVRSGAVRSADQDGDLACRIMREEMKALLLPDSGRYNDERELVKTGQSGLAMASLTATCISRILAERIG